MSRVFSFAILFGVAVAPAAHASNPAGDFDFEFTFSGPAVIDEDPGISFFPLTFDEPNLPIQFLELEIAGLSHPNPGDLNIFLVDPFGNTLEIMDDRGDQIAIDNVTLTFNDKAVDVLPPSTDMTAITSGLYQPEGPGDFSMFTNGGTDAWLLVVADDDAGQGDIGGFDSYTLRVVVPEPATLSLLVLGGGSLVLWRRKRR